MDSKFADETCSFFLFWRIYNLTWKSLYNLLKNL
jgi:hypothetical protein